MNIYLKKTPFNNIPHDYALAIKICKRLRPNIFKCTPKPLADLITKCWDARAENRPTAKEVYQKLDNWYKGEYKDNKIYSQMHEYIIIKSN
jgi:hypothetical protein